MRRERTTSLAVALLALLATVAPKVLAQSKPPPPEAPEQRAAADYDAAVRAFKEGRYEEAITLLQQAYALSKKATILQNLGRAYERLGRLKEARDAFQEYIDHDPFALDLVPIQSEIKALDQRIAEGDTLTQTARNATARAATATNESLLTRKRAFMVAEESRHHASPVPWIVLGVGVAGAINGSIFAVLADTQQRTAASVTLDQIAAQRAADQAQTYATIANVSFAIGGTLAIGGLIWGILDGTSASRARERVRLQFGGLLVTFQ